MSHNLAVLAKPDLIRFDLKLNKVQLRPKETRPVWPKLGGHNSGLLDTHFFEPINVTLLGIHHHLQSELIFF